MSSLVNQQQYPNVVYSLLDYPLSPLDSLRAPTCALHCYKQPLISMLLLHDPLQALLARGEGTYDLHDLQDVQTRGLKEELLASRAMRDSLKGAMEEQKTQSEMNAGEDTIIAPLPAPPIMSLDRIV